MRFFGAILRGPKSRMLLGLGLLLLAGFLATSTISYVISRKAIRTSILNNELPLSSNNIYSEIQHDLFQPILISSLMANDTFVKDWILKGETDEQDITKYLAHIKERYGTITAFLVSENTRRYYNATSVLKTVSESDPVDKWFFRVRTMAQPYEINVDPDMSNGNTMAIFINYRITDKEGKLLGITGVGLSVTSVKKLMQEYHSRYQREVYFYNREGQLVLYSQSDAGLKPVSSQANEVMIREVLARIARGETDITASVVGRNGTMANYRYIPELNWILVVEQESDGTSGILFKTFGINFLVCLAITAVLLGVFRQTVMRYQNHLEAKNRRLEAQKQQLVHANEAREKLFAIIGHDLRGPVGNIRTSLELLDHGVLGEEEFREIREDMGHGVDQVLDALDNLMEWGRLQSGPLQAVPQAVNLRETASEVLRLYSLVIKEKALLIENTIPEAAIVLADPSQLQSILRNLLSNAMKFTRRQGSISLSAHEEAQGWRLNLVDSGIGLEAERITAILDRHHHVTSTLGTDGEKGLGLGLQLCLDFIEANDGRLSIESTPGQGASFSILLRRGP